MKSKLIKKRKKLACISYNRFLKLYSIYKKEKARKGNLLIASMHELHSRTRKSKNNLNHESVSSLISQIEYDEYLIKSNKEWDAAFKELDVDRQRRKLSKQFNSCSRTINKMVTYSVSNKNNIYSCSSSFEINDRIKILVMIIEHPIKQINLITDIVKQISNNGRNIKFDNHSTDWSGQCSEIHRLFINEFIKNTNDLVFKMIDNSKITVQLHF